MILDGTLLPIDRIAADRPYSFGKHRKHGMNVQVIADPPPAFGGEVPPGRLIWPRPRYPVLCTTSRRSAPTTSSML